MKNKEVMYGDRYRNTSGNALSILAQYRVSLMR